MLLSGVVEAEELSVELKEVSRKIRRLAERYQEQECAYNVKEMMLKEGTRTKVEFVR